MIHLVTDVGCAEPDILMPGRGQPLLIKNLEGDLLQTIPAPELGWSHRQLMDETSKLSAQFTNQGADAFLGSEWIGSTEV